MLFNLKNAIYYHTPWPHVIIDNFIDDPRIVEVLCNHPQLGRFMRANVEQPAGRYDFNEVQVKELGLFPEEVVNTLATLSRSTEVLTMLETFFMDHLLDVYPLMTREYFNTFADVSATYGCNNYCDDETPLKGVHLDSGKKIYTGMIYFRESGDVVGGSNIVLQSYDDDGNVLAEKEIPYSTNVAVFWPATFRAWHFVQPRNPSSTNLRRFINYVVDGKERLHDYSSGRGDSKQYGWKKVAVCTHLHSNWDVVFNNEYQDVLTTEDCVIEALEKISSSNNATVA